MLGRHTLLYHRFHSTLFRFVLSARQNHNIMSSSSNKTDKKNNQKLNQTLDSLQDVIGQDAGNRGMKSLIVEEDLNDACKILGAIPPPSCRVLILSGFPCCTTQSPPTETDGPPGAMAIARAALQLGYAKVTVVTDECNRAVFAAAVETTKKQTIFRDGATLDLQTFVPENKMTESDKERFNRLKTDCSLVIACERAGPAADGHCYTMRGIDMTNAGLIAPIHDLLSTEKKFIAIGDGGNELGMGKVLPHILDNPKISEAKKIACVTPCDYLIAASVSNWGGYALAAGASLVRAHEEADKQFPNKSLSALVEEWTQKCLPTTQDEVDLLNACVEAGCRDGVSGKQEATVDGMPLETSMDILENIRQTVLSSVSDKV